MPEIEGSCIGKMGPMMTLSIANIIIDIIVLFIPVKVILPLKIPLRQKISLIIIFAAGGLYVEPSVHQILAPFLMSLIACVPLRYSEQFSCPDCSLRSITHGKSLAKSSGASLK